VEVVDQEGQDCPDNVAEAFDAADLEKVQGYEWLFVRHYFHKVEQYVVTIA
jgi:hypothetical protein